MSILLNLYKNGSAFKVGFSSSASMAFSTFGALVFLNGSTDYIEAYA
jgi:hypothetical protein